MSPETPIRKPLTDAARPRTWHPPAEIDFLFYSDSPFVWAAEASHKRLKGELDPIVGAKTAPVHKEDTSFVTA